MHNGAGTDLTKDGSGRSYWDQITGNAPRGVLRVFARFNDSRGEPTITSSESEVQGINKDLLDVLADSGKSASDLEMPTFVAGIVAADLGGGSIEAGRNEAGSVTYSTGRSGEQILETLGDGSAEEGASRLLTRIT